MLDQKGMSQPEKLGRGSSDNRPAPRSELDRSS